MRLLNERFQTGMMAVFHTYFGQKTTLLTRGEEMYVLSTGDEFSVLHFYMGI